MLNTYLYQIQFTVHYDDGRQLTDNRQVRAGTSEEVNEAFVEILKNEYPNLGIGDIKIFQIKE